MVFLMKKLNLFLFVGAFVLVILCAQIQPFNQVASLSTSAATAIASEAPSKTIIEAVVANGSLKTFLAGLRAVGLVETLIGKGPFTVFAPSDEAFAALGGRTVKELFEPEPEDRDRLTKIINYHVVSGKAMSSDLKSGEAKTLGGNPLKIKVGSSEVMVNDAKVIKADILASNGVIHIIDKVMMPPGL